MFILAGNVLRRLSISGSKPTPDSVCPNEISYSLAVEIRQFLFIIQKVRRRLSIETILLIFTTWPDYTEALVYAAAVITSPLKVFHPASLGFSSRKTGKTTSNLSLFRFSFSHIFSFII